jgi:hypothetical protein
MGNRLHRKGAKQGVWLMNSEINIRFLLHVHPNPENMSQVLHSRTVITTKADSVLPFQTNKIIIYIFSELCGSHGVKPEERNRERQQQVQQLKPRMAPLYQTIKFFLRAGALAIP